LELLSEMAREVGYKKLEQTQIDRYFFDATYLHGQAKTQDLTEEWLRVLKGSENFGAARTHMR